MSKEGKQNNNAATERCPEAKIINLDYPKKFDGKVISKLTMRPPKFRDRLRASKEASHPADIEFHLIADLCEVCEEDLGNLEDCDAFKLQEAYQNFLGLSPQSLIAGLS